MTADPGSEPTIHQLFDLTGKTALLTGGCGHLGSTMSRALAEAGARVVITSRDGEKARAAAAQLPAPGGARHHGMGLDLLDPEALAGQFQQAAELVGPIDILVNNAHAALAADWTTVTPAEFSKHLTNATCYFELARLVHQQAVARSAPASIINIGSMYGVVGSYPEAYAGVCAASPVAYHTLKGGLIHMTRHLAVYWAADQVRVNCLSPGPFPSEKAAPEMVRRLITKSPMQRMGKAWEVKGAILFLASDASSYMTGQNLLIDGGWTAW